jgi:hypothetical protein
MIAYRRYKQALMPRIRSRIMRRPAAIAATIACRFSLGCSTRSKTRHRWNAIHRAAPRLLTKCGVVRSNARTALDFIFTLCLAPNAFSDLRSSDNPKALTELMPPMPRVGAIADGSAASAQNDGDPAAAQVLTREHRVRAQVLTCRTLSGERTRNCGRVNVHGDAGGGPCMPARQTWGV